jgi:hypothetical protein
MVRRLSGAVFPAALVFVSAVYPAVARAQPASPLAEPGVDTAPALLLSAAASPVGLDDLFRGSDRALVGSVQTRLKRFLVLEGAVTRWSVFDDFSTFPPGVTIVSGVSSAEYRARKVWTVGANLLLRGGTSRVTGFFGGGLSLRFADHDSCCLVICRPGAGGPPVCSEPTSQSLTTTSLSPQFLVGGEFWVTPRLAAYGGARFAFASDQWRETAGFAPLAGLRVALRTTNVVAEEPVRLPDPNRAQGKDIRVTLNDGTTHRGKLVAFSASQVTLDSQAVPLADVREIEKVSHAVRNATIISLLAAVPTFLALGPAFDMGNDVVFAVVGPGVASGIAVGAVIAAVRKPGNVIYRAPGASASISVRPILGRERKGVALATRW